MERKCECLYVSLTCCLFQVPNQFAVTGLVISIARKVEGMITTDESWKQPSPPKKKKREKKKSRYLYERDRKRRGESHQKVAGDAVSSHVVDLTRLH